MWLIWIICWLEEPDLNYLSIVCLLCPACDSNLLPYPVPPRKDAFKSSVQTHASKPTASRAPPKMRKSGASSPPRKKNEQYASSGKITTSYCLVHEILEISAELAKLFEYFRWHVEKNSWKEKPNEKIIVQGSGACIYLFCRPVHVQICSKLLHTLDIACEHEPSNEVVVSLMLPI